jgi:hypothetical protein
VLVARLKVVSGARVAVGNVAIGPPAIVLMVTAPAAIEAHAVIGLVAAVHSRWLRKLNLKN